MSEKSLRKGDRFNESEFFDDPVTSRPTRRLTTQRDFSQTPTYHLNAAFSADSRYLVLASWDDEGDSWLLKADVASGEMTVLSALPGETGERFNGNNVGIVQASGWVATNTGKTLRLCHLDTLEERVLLDLSGTERRFGHPIGSIDGRKIFIPRLSKRLVIGETRDVSATHLEVDIETGGITELFCDEGRACNHVVPNPVDPDLLLPTNAKPLYMGELMETDATNPKKVIRATGAIPAFIMYAEKGRTDVLASKKVPLLFSGAYHADTLIFLNTPAITHGCPLMMGASAFDGKTGLSGLMKHDGGANLVLGYCMIVPASNQQDGRGYLRFIQTLV